MFTPSKLVIDWCFFKNHSINQKKLGNIWFISLDNPNAKDLEGYGKTIDKPFATFDFLDKHIIFGNNDIIYVLPEEIQK